LTIDSDLFHLGLYGFGKIGGFGVPEDFTGKTRAGLEDTIIDDEGSLSRFGLYGLY
jgi:hypothetical protein